MTGYGQIHVWKCQAHDCCAQLVWLPTDRTVPPRGRPGREAGRPVRQGSPSGRPGTGGGRRLCKVAGAAGGRGPRAGAIPADALRRRRTGVPGREREPECEVAQGAVQGRGAGRQAERAAVIVRPCLQSGAFMPGRVPLRLPVCVPAPAAAAVPRLASPAGVRAVAGPSGSPPAVSGGKACRAAATPANRASGKPIRPRVLGPAFQAVLRCASQGRGRAAVFFDARPSVCVAHLFA